MICLVALGRFLAQRAANDWLVLLMVERQGFRLTAGTAVYLTYTIGLVLSRFIAPILLTRIERSTLTRLGCLFMTMGLLLAVFSHGSQLAIAWVSLHGMGASIGAPLTVSATGEEGGNSVKSHKSIEDGLSLAMSSESYV